MTSSEFHFVFSSRLPFLLESLHPACAHLVLSLCELAEAEWHSFTEVHIRDAQWVKSVQLSHVGNTWSP